MTWGRMSYWRTRGSANELPEYAHETGWAKDAAELEAKLSRLPPAQPCFQCPSLDDTGRMKLIAPQLGKLKFETGVADAALFICSLCGVRWGEALDKAERER